MKAKKRLFFILHTVEEIYEWLEKWNVCVFFYWPMFLMSFFKGKNYIILKQGEIYATRWWSYAARQHVSMINRTRQIQLHSATDIVSFKRNSPASSL